MDRLKIQDENIELYRAGHPFFPRNFTRDSIISGILMNDAILLKNQLDICAKRQGKSVNPSTGEEEGKIFHEYPGVIIDSFSTEYSACDTTALFLIGHEHYQKLTGDMSFVKMQSDNILRATEYIKRHLSDNIFIDDPKLSNSERFALKVTYWKDSEMAKRDNGSPSYPVAYLLAHAINLAGMRSASRLMNSDEYFKISEEMKKKIHNFFDVQNGTIAFAIDSIGRIECINSDALHALYYLEIDDLVQAEIDSIEKSSAELETQIGYLTMSPKQKDSVADQYHASTVWPFEQAIIHAGSKKFGLGKIHSVAERILEHLDTAPEIFVVKENGFQKGGCDPQLWTIAAKKYFEGQKEK